MKRTPFLVAVASGLLLLAPAAAKGQTASTGTSGDGGTVTPIWVGTGSSGGGSSGGTFSVGTPADTGGATAPDSPACSKGVGPHHEGNADTKAPHDGRELKTHHEKAKPPKPEAREDCDRSGAVAANTSGDSWAQQMQIDNGGWKFR